MTRIVAGRAGGLGLRAVPGSGTRPTTDRTKEAVFSWLSSRGWLDGTAVADLFAGSGALGLEAVSRGARSVVLIERDRKAAAVCRANAEAVNRALGAAVASVVARPVDPVLDEVLARLAERHPAFRAEPAADVGNGPTPDDAAAPDGPWDLVLADPPYPLDGTALAATLERIGRALVPGGLLVLERSSRSPEPDWPAGPAGLEPVESRRYGETTVYYCQRPRAD